MSNNKTVSDYIETLPPRIKVKALRNIGKMNNNPDRVLNREAISLHRALNVSFTWANTPEGGKYWTLVANGEFEKAERLPEERKEAHLYRESIHHFMYFIFNFPHNFWEKAFLSEPQWMQEHIEEKFHECYKRYGAVEGVARFFMELDTERRDQLMSWVRDNYTGYNMKINTDGEKTNS